MKKKFTKRQITGLLVGIPLFMIMLVLPRPETMSPEAHKTLAVTLLMAFWWITEVLPIQTTALLPWLLKNEDSIAWFYLVQFAHPVKLKTLSGGKELIKKELDAMEPMSKEEFFANLVIFDPSEVIDRATWKDPHQYPKGIKTVIVNG